MKNTILLLIIVVLVVTGVQAVCQGVAINSDNSAPDPHAMLDIKSTSKGVIFPTMTTAQRNSISNPPGGLHIFNTSTGSLEYYDSDFKSWISYCGNCIPFTDTIANSTYHYVLPAGAAGMRKIIIVINANVTVYGNTGVPALDLSGAGASASILINNHGSVYGSGGVGGNGGNVADNSCTADYSGSPGGTGGSAIYSKPGTHLVVNNYGVIAGGGGGGGGGAAGVDYPNTGGGGGGGAGDNPVFGGIRGSYTYYAGLGCSSVYTGVLGQDGQPGTITTGGTGGNGGASGLIASWGAKGGNGGALGQAGQNGNNSTFHPAGQGGQPGKAIQGNSGNNSVINLGTGAVYGVID